MKPKDIIQAIAARLADVKTLHYIDRDWGQLDEEQPAVKFPCALVDVEQIQFEDCLNTVQTAECDITITVAVLNFHNTSRCAPKKDKGYDVFDIIDDIHAALHLYGTQNLAPLVRRSIVKIDVGKDHAVYQLTYHTAYTTRLDREYDTTPTAPLSIKINYQRPQL